MTASEAFEVSLKAVSRRFSRWEKGVDGVLHACAIVAAIVGAIILILLAASRGDAEDVAVVIYSVGMLAMFGCSCAYNLGRFTRHEDWLRKLDHAGIFLMIAGTYTPFTLLALQGVVELDLHHSRLVDRAPRHRAPPGARTPLRPRVAGALPRPRLDRARGARRRSSTRSPRRR